MPFTVGSLVGDFTATEESFSSRAGLVEELSLTIIVASSADWGALFDLVTPREMVSVRSSKAQTGLSTIVVDLGGGAGVGTLDVDGIDPHDALLVELASEAPVSTGGPRVAKATFLLIPA